MSSGILGACWGINGIKSSNRVWKLCSLQQICCQRRQILPKFCALKMGRRNDTYGAIGDGCEGKGCSYLSLSDVEVSHTVRGKLKRYIDGLLAIKN